MSRRAGEVLLVVVLPLLQLTSGVQHVPFFARVHEEQSHRHRTNGSAAAPLHSSVEAAVVSSLQLHARSWLVSQDMQPADAQLGDFVDFEEERPFSTPLLLLAIGTSLTMLAAFAYYWLRPSVPLHPSKECDKIDPSFLDRRMWAHSEFGCILQPGTFVFTLLFPTIRWAETMRMAGLLNFPLAFLALEAAVTLTMFLFIAHVRWCAVGILLLLIVLVYYRQRIRQLFRIPFGNVRTVAEDFCMHAFCTICALIQEAGQLEVAHLARHEAVCPVSPEQCKMHEDSS